MILFHNIKKMKKHLKWKIVDLRDNYSIWRSRLKVWNKIMKNSKVVSFRNRWRKNNWKNPIARSLKKNKLLKVNIKLVVLMHRFKQIKNSVMHQNSKFLHQLHLLNKILLDVKSLHKKLRNRKRGRKTEPHRESMMLVGWMQMNIKGLWRWHIWEDDSLFCIYFISFTILLMKGIDREKLSEYIEKSVVHEDNPESFKYQMEV